MLMKLWYHNPNSGVRIWGRTKESEIKMIGEKGNIIEPPLGKLPVLFLNSVHGRQRNNESRHKNTS